MPALNSNDRRRIFHARKMRRYAEYEEFYELFPDLYAELEFDALAVEFLTYHGLPLSQENIDEHTQGQVEYDEFLSNQQ